MSVPIRPATDFRALPARLRELAAGGNLNAGTLRELSRASGASEAQLVALATFYRLENSGARPLTVCRGPACAAAGGNGLLQAFEAALGVTEGECAPRQHLRFGASACLGACSAAPVVCVAGERVAAPKIHGGAVEKFIVGASSGKPTAAPPLHVGAAPRTPAIVLRHHGRDMLSLQAARAAGVYAPWENARNVTASMLREAIAASGLRERAGSGAAVAEKLQRASELKLPRLVISAHAGIPGSAAANYLLAHDPHAVIAGALLAAQACGAAEVILTAPSDDAAALNQISAAAAEASAAFERPLEVWPAPSAWMLTEEAALLRAVDGRTPVIDPAAPANAPPSTVVLDVESVHALPWIMQHGAAAFRAIGSPTAPGTILLTLSGSVQRPGFYEIPFGLSLRAVIGSPDLGSGARGAVRAVLLGGPLGVVLTPDQLDLPLDYSTAERLGGNLRNGSLLVLTDADDLTAFARSVLSLLALENCAACTPCHAGSVRAVELLSANSGPAPAGPSLYKVLDCMRLASACALGRQTAQSVRQVLKLLSA